VAGNMGINAYIIRNEWYHTTYNNTNNTSCYGYR